MSDRAAGLVLVTLYVLMLAVALSRSRATTEPHGASSVMFLTTRIGANRCVFENVIIGDGAIHVRSHCDPDNTNRR